MPVEGILNALGLGLNVANGLSIEQKHATCDEKKVDVDCFENNANLGVEGVVVEVGKDWHVAEKKTEIGFAKVDQQIAYHYVQLTEVIEMLGKSGVVAFVNYRIIEIFVACLKSHAANSTHEEELHEGVDVWW